jgi:hypothetical protein
MSKDCHAIYERLATIREPFLRRARTAAVLTIPSLMPPLGYNGTQDLPSPFQSIGARGVNNLTAKLTMAEFPPNAPFFQYKVDPFSLKQLEEVKNAKNPETARTQVEANLLEASEAVLTELETDGFRVTAYEGNRHLVVCGNVLLQYLETGPRALHLDQYVVCRDPSTGAPYRVIAKECITEESIPDDMPVEFHNMQPEETRNAETLYNLYTHAYLEDGKWYICQSINGFMVPDSNVVQDPDDFEFIPLRLGVNSGEDYSDSYVTEYIGDLISLEGLSQGIVELAAANSRVIPLVNPAGITNIDDIASAENGKYTPGRADDITFGRLDKYGDSQVAANTAKGIESRLSFAFLLNSSVQRDAERVTAEEIRFMAQELEENLGGVYSLAAKEFQLPLVKLIQRRMQRENRLPKIPAKFVHTAVVTGIEALGRGNDANRLTQFMAALAQAFLAGLPDVLAVEVDRAEGRLDQPGQAPDEGRLAAARQAHDDEDLARPDIERDVVDRDRPAVLADRRIDGLGRRNAAGAARQAVLGRAEHLPEIADGDRRTVVGPGTSGLGSGSRCGRLGNGGHAASSDAGRRR